VKPSAARVLIVLRAAGRVGAPTGLLCRPEIGGARFGARVKELRQAGCLIENVRERPGSDRYWLRHLPDEVLEDARSSLDPMELAAVRAAAGDQAPRRGVPGTAHNLDGPCFCDGCMQRAAGSGIVDHELTQLVEPVTAAGRARAGGNQLPLLSLEAA
jgi:hypothetical protein